MASTQPGSSEAEQKKRRACDECRTRKLACSKEPDGCRRCRRESIACIYSAQKQMGRPRKRPRFDGEDVDMAGNASGSGTNHDASLLTVDTTPVIMPTPNNNSNTNNEGDVGLSMLADQALSPAEMSFFDFLGVGGDGTSDDGSNINLDPFLQEPSRMQPLADTHSLASIPSVAAMGAMPCLSAPTSRDPASEQAQPTLVTPNLTYHRLFPQSLFGVNFSNLDFSTSSIESLESGVPDVAIPGQIQAQTQHQHQHVGTSNNQHSRITNSNLTNTVSPAPSLTTSAVSQPPSSNSPSMGPNAASVLSSSRPHLTPSLTSNLPPSMQSTSPHRFDLLPCSPKLAPSPDTTSSQALPSEQQHRQQQHRQQQHQQHQSAPAPPTLTSLPTTSTVDAYSKASAAWLLTAPNRVCGCLARLYLALDSLQHLPAEIGPAMSVARNAAHTAHDTILCPSCSPENVADVDYRPPMQSYQNLMILGALLPSLAHTYRRIVAMVDEEAARASAAKVRLAISLTEYGGVWGHMARWDNVCEQTSSLDNSIVDPPLWRLVVRALLKMDVYGFHLDRADVDMKNGTGGFKECQLRTEGKNVCSASSNTAHAAGANASTGTGDDGAQHLMVPVHLGLKDIAEMMLERARRRHKWMDAAYDAGLLKNYTDANGFCAYQKLPPGEKHSCEKMIDIAKQEIDQLVIV